MPIDQGDKIFEVGLEVMVHLKKGGFHIGKYSKLKMNNFYPCKILRRFDNGNPYEVELPDDMDISSIFNFVDLYKYHESKDEVDVSDYYPKKKIEEVEQILEQRVGKSMRGKDYYEYLVKWKNKPSEDAP